MSEPEKIIIKARVVYREAEPTKPSPRSFRIVHRDTAESLSDAEKYRLWQAKQLIEEAGLEADAD